MCTVAMAKKEGRHIPTLNGQLEAEIKALTKYVCTNSRDLDREF